MRLSITKVIHDIGDKAFSKMLLSGAFPEVHYSETVNERGFRWKSYSMFEYSDKWATFMKILDTWIKQEKLDEKLGVFSRKHSADFLAKVTKLANEITVEDMNNQFVRFHTWMDEL